MSYADKWSKVDVNRLVVAEKLKDYGHLLKWKDCKQICLDIGCGEGTLTKHVLYPYIQNHLEKLVAVDKLDGMIQFANEHSTHQKIEYQTVDILNEGMIATMYNQFDHLFSLFVSHLIPETRSFLTSLHRILKADGQIFVITPTDSIFKQVSSELYQEEKWSKYKLAKSTFTDYTPDPVQYITDLLQEIGFKVDLCEHDNRYITINNFKDFVAAIFDMYQNLEVIPSELLDDFAGEFLQKCREKCINLGEPEKYGMRVGVLALIATKSS